jgi:hypothetical protein
MPSSEAAAQAATAPTCGSPEWRLFHERVGRYFEKDEAGDASGTCAICGTDLRNVVKGSAGPTCPPIRSAASKRSKSDPAKPIAFDPAAAAALGKAALTNVGCVVLIEPDRCFVATNVAPSRQLPADMTIAPVMPGSTGRFLAELGRRPPKAPFLLIVFDNKIPPLALSHSASRAAWCGSSAIGTIDLTRIPDVAALAARLGPKRFATLASLKERLAQGGLSEADRKTLAEMRADGAITADDLDSVPERSSLLYSIVDKVAAEAAAPNN